MSALVPSPRKGFSSIVTVLLEAAVWMVDVVDNILKTWVQLVRFSSIVTMLLEAAVLMVDVADNILKTLL